jgi:pimeloyl-ACP methyl ester carboxylesterase
MAKSRWLWQIRQDFKGGFMKRLLVLGLATLALAGCSQNHDEIKVTKLSAGQSSAVLTNLALGKVLVDSPEESECKDFRSKLPSNYFQDEITVPENWDQPQGAQIKVFYYGIVRPGKDTVVFYNGGPAGDSHSSYEVLKDAPEYKNFSFVFVDQRGTGCSSAYPSEPTQQNLEKLMTYGSRSIVKDSEAIRSKILGNKPWKIFGQSFGGMIVQRYLTIDLSHIKSANAHGLSVMSDSALWLAMRMKSQKRVLENYFAKYPDDRQNIPALRALVSETRCFTDGESKICGKSVVDGLTIFLGFSESWPSMHKLIGNLIKNNTLDESLFQKYIENYVFGVFANNYGAGSVIGAVDMSTSGKVDPRPCVTSTDILKKQGEDPSQWIINECRLLDSMTNDGWDPLWKSITKTDDLTLAEIKQSLQMNPQVPFYLYSGQLDVFVPVETFAEEISFLGSLVNYSSFPTSGHEGFYTESLVWKNLAK